VRVWVAGCATGEEAYSIAILLHEHAATLQDPPKIQIFATDIDEKGYAWGREALYPASAVAEIPPERLRRHSSPRKRGATGSRSRCGRACSSPSTTCCRMPFSRLDLISCRNLLIYLQPEAQERAIETFHYALRRAGAALPRLAESAGESGHFVPVTRRRRSTGATPPRTGSLPRSRPRIRLPGPGGGSRGEGRLAARTGSPTERSTCGCWSVTHRRAWSSTSAGGGPPLGTGGRYLHLGEGEPSHNLMDLTRGELRMELRTALHQAFAKGLPDHPRHPYSTAATS
jgi:two-component system, chemotaxis family, CheB/CheR fusion protein